VPARPYPTRLDPRQERSAQEYEWEQQERARWQRRYEDPRQEYDDPRRQGTADYVPAPDYPSPASYGPMGEPGAERTGPPQGPPPRWQGPGAGAPLHDWPASSQGASPWPGPSFGTGTAHERGSPAHGFRGHGPKGYTRSDERIREDLCDRLSDADDIDASEVECQVRNGEVVLTGSVPTRALKHRIENLADRVSGVRDVRNEIKVGRAESEQTDGSPASRSPFESAARAASQPGPGAGKRSGAKP